MAKLGWLTTTRSPHAHRAYRNAEVALCGLRLGASPVWTNRARNPCPECRGRDPERAEFIEFLIDYLDDVRTMKSSPAAVDPLRLPVSFFDGAEPFLRTDLTHDGSGMIEAAEPADVPWPLDIRIIAGSEGALDDGLGEWDGDDARTGWTLQRARSLSAKEVRGRVFPSLPYPMEWTVAWPAYHDALRFIVGHPRPEVWTSIGLAGTVRSSRQPRLTKSDIFSPRIRVLLGIWRLRPQQWRVYFALDGKPGIELPSDPIGARAAFRLRDLPAGKSRRAALLHWVSEHWRGTRSDPREELLVREHLAGQRVFHWNGLTCKITPSRVDQDRDQAAIEGREAARLSGTDRRPRRT